MSPFRWLSVKAGECKWYVIYIQLVSKCHTACSIKTNNNMTWYRMWDKVLLLWLLHLPAVDLVSSKYQISTYAFVLDVISVRNGFHYCLKIWPFNIGLRCQALFYNAAYQVNKFDEFFYLKLCICLDRNSKIIQTFISE